MPSTDLPNGKPHANAGQRRVLIADDNGDACDTLATLFDLSGYSVRCTSNGLQAFQEASAWRPDFILLDLGMPVMDGYEVARRIREEAWGKDPTLVAISGRSQPRDRERAFAVGFDMHFAKPVDFDSLLKTLTKDATN